MIKVILRKKIDKLGKDRDIVFVKDGFARNFLLPKGLALIATKDNINKIEQEKRKLEHNKEIEKNKAKELADKLQGFSCTITVEAKDDNLYGSITAVEISKALKDEQLNIDKTDILLEEPIEKLGIYEVEVRLHPEVTIKIKVWVVKS